MHIATVRALISGGYSIAEIAEIFVVSPQDVEAFVALHHRPPSDAALDTADLADRTGFSEAALYNARAHRSP